MKILVIDNEPEMVSLLQLALEPTEVEIFSARSGMEGIALASRLRPDILLIDAQMPDMNSIQIFRKIREFCQSPVIILSTSNNPATIAAMLDAGADDYLVRPVSKVVLRAFINKFSRRSHTRLPIGAVLPN